ncbi:hypothetical protein ABW20_dc0108225 [Dactylellina cionopaga]|nr:hypothetical protein ABW20_dc0108225 [Dactylellina cionopaga]
MDADGERRRPSPVDDEMNYIHPPKRQKLSHTVNYVPDEPETVAISPVLRLNDYTVAWICALHIELAAALTILDERHKSLPVDAEDSNVYVFGSIKQHNIVIACLPNEQYGTNNAANVLTNLMRTFQSIRMGLMVGIGGGVPGREDIRLGDIVVGTRVMQYDLGKIVQDGEMERTANPKIPNHLTGKTITALRASHEQKRIQFLAILREKFENLSEYHRPNLPDNLFVATCAHSSNKSCDECEKSKLVPRRERDSHDPKVHYGTIASGNQVMKSGTTRDNVARQLNALCFEMEIAGMMDTFPCLSIRGICDYSDSHKNKDWQRYAAATAAAYAKELVQELQAAETDSKKPYQLKNSRLTHSKT